MASKLPRKRASKPKTRTGCKTCKIRHLKCGEERPACNNCTSTGRQCDGYELVVSLSDGRRKPHRNVRPSSRCCLAPGTDLSSRSNALIALNFQERRAFDFFVTQASIGTFESNAELLLSQLTLQVSHSEPAIVNAIVAVGTLQRARGSALWNGYLSDPDPALYELSLQKYSLSVMQIKDMIEDNTRDLEGKVILLLLSCLLFIRFEMLNDCDEFVVQHLRKGLSVLHGHVLGRQDTNMPRNHLVLTTYPRTTFDRFVEVFTHLDCDCVMLGEREPVYTLSADVSPGKNYTVHSTSFGSLDEARLNLDVLANAVYRVKGELIRLAGDELETQTDVSALNSDWYYCFTQAKSRVIDISSQPKVAARLYNLEEQTSKWIVAFTSLPAATSRSGLHGWLLLQLRFFMVWLQVICWRDSEDLQIDRHTTFFSATVDRAEQLLKLIADSKNLLRDTRQGIAPSWPTFELTSGILMPLYHIAIKCRNRMIREKAVDLLCESNFQEGVFDNYNVAIYARRIIDLETGLEGNVTNEDSPPAERIVEATMCVELEEQGMGRLVCARRNDNCDLGFELFEDRFSICRVAAVLQERF